MKIGLMLLLLWPLLADAAPLWRTTHEGTIACFVEDSPHAAEVKLHEARKSGAAMPPGCGHLKKGFQFSRYNEACYQAPCEPGVNDIDAYGAVLRTDGDRDFFYVSEADTEPVLDADGQPVSDPCDAAGAGGEFDRLEAAPDGRLYLKRYLFTTRCKDGRVQQHVKRLN